MVQRWGNHRDAIYPKTGLTLPSKILVNGSKTWCKNGKQHRDGINPDTGITLPAKIYEDETK